MSLRRVICSLSSILLVFIAISNVFCFECLLDAQTPLVQRFWHAKINARRVLMILTPTERRGARKMRIESKTRIAIAYRLCERRANCSYSRHSPRFARPASIRQLKAIKASLCFIELLLRVMTKLSCLQSKQSKHFRSPFVFYSLLFRLQRRTKF